MYRRMEHALEALTTEQLLAQEDNGRPKTCRNETYQQRIHRDLQDWVPFTFSLLGKSNDPKNRKNENNNHINDLPSTYIISTLFFAKSGIAESLAKRCSDKHCIFNTFQESTQYL